MPAYFPPTLDREARRRDYPRLRARIGAASHFATIPDDDPSPGIANLPRSISPLRDRLSAVAPTLAKGAASRHYEAADRDDGNK